MSATLKTLIPSSCRERHTAVGILYLAGTVLAYLATLAPIVCLSSPWVRVLFALLNGIVIAALFVVGHDACHGALTPSVQWNYVIGQLSFLPSLHPFTSWNWGHNSMHHAWTNLRGHDPGYPPYSPDEFRRLGTWRRFQARLYRTLLGLALLYLCTVWWPHIIAPGNELRARLDRVGAFGRERVSVLLYSTALIAFASFVGISKGLSPARAAIEALIWVFAVPFLVFNWLIGWSTFMHHSNPSVRWFDDQSAWHASQPQLASTVHVVFPRWIELALHDIMDHTAHHIDPNVPLYHLHEAQRELEHALGDRVIVRPFRYSDLRTALKTCRLYDYRAHAWHDWDGTLVHQIETPVASVM